MRILVRPERLKRYSKQVGDCSITWGAITMMDAIHGVMDRDYASPRLVVDGGGALGSSVGHT